MLTRVNQETISKIGCPRRPLTNGLQLVIPRRELHGQFQLYGGILDRWCRGKDVTIIPIMHGGGYAWQRLMREMSPDSAHIERAIVAQSYGDRQTNDVVRVYMDWILPTDIANRHIILVDDVYESGDTMVEVSHRLSLHNPAGVYPFFMLRKDRHRTGLVTPRWVMFDIEDGWVVGAGLDWQGKYRHLPYVAELPRNGAGV